MSDMPNEDELEQALLDVVIKPPLLFSASTAVTAEGARIGLVSCEICGATILLDYRDKVGRMQQHRLWHEGA